MPSASKSGWQIEVDNGCQTYLFQRGSPYHLVSPADPTASLVEAEDGSAVTFCQGDRTLAFYGFGTDMPEELQGSLNQVTLPSGHVYTVNYNTSPSPQPGAPLNAPLSISRDDAQELYQIQYDAQGNLGSLAHQIQSGGSWKQTVQVSFDYHAADGDYGLLGDLKAVHTNVFDAQSGAWVQQQATYYTYDSATGQVRHVFDARQYQALLTATGKSDLNDFDQATDDATLAAYAGQSYTYCNGQVATQTCPARRNSCL